MQKATKEREGGEPASWFYNKRNNFWICLPGISTSAQQIPGALEVRTPRVSLSGSLHHVLRREANYKADFEKEDVVRPCIIGRCTGMPDKGKPCSYTVSCCNSVCLRAPSGARSDSVPQLVSVPIERSVSLKRMPAWCWAERGAAQKARKRRFALRRLQVDGLRAAWCLRFRAVWRCPSRSPIWGLVDSLSMHWLRLSSTGSGT